MRYYLQVIRGPKFNEPVPLQESNLIGRGSEATIQISDPSISRRHLEIRILSGKHVFLVDLESGNGTKVGEEKLVPLQPYEFVTFFMPIELSKSVAIQIEERPF